jgi:hypothetical protein
MPSTASEWKPFLFIYQVSDAVGALSYVSVVVLGRNRDQAEKIAINQVHQQQLHILRTDTATAAPWLDEQHDGQTLGELAQFGVAVKQLAA